MNHAFEAPDLFDEFGFACEHLAPRKPIVRKKTVARGNAKQLGIFTETSGNFRPGVELRSEEHTSELQSH